jgi:hypothetical protein
VSLPISEELARMGFYIPSGLGMDLADIPVISGKIEHVLRQF